MNAPDDAAHYRDEPLDLTTWLAEIERVLDDLNGASAAEAERLIRRSFYLSHLAPPPLWSVVASPQSEAAFERMLEDMAPDEAVDGLIGRRLELRTADRHGLVAAVLTAQDWGVTGHWESRSPAIAIVGAWVKCALALADRIGAGTAPELTDPRRSRSSRHLKSTEH